MPIQINPATTFSTNINPKSTALAVPSILPPLTTTVAFASIDLPINQAMSAISPVIATGGTGTYTFAITPALPAGLSFNTATGQITGTPTILSGATTRTVTVTDIGNGSIGQTSATFSLTVSPLPALTTTQAIPATTLTVDIAATPFTPVTAAGGFGTLTFAAAPALPAGLSFNTATGQITGTPSASIENINGIDFLVVGGGGAGGHIGGGGAGGHQYFSSQSLILGTIYTVTVGPGGAASASATGASGSPSVFGAYTSASGGGGAGEAALPTAGGSGGGGGGVNGTSRNGAPGNTPSTSPSQGNAGGNGNDNGAGTAFAGGGGGGAGGVGNNASGTTTAGNGGLGTPNSITGSSVTRSAGGGGGAYQFGVTATAGTGGSSIGGNGGRNGLNATGGSPNTGSGGGGNGLNASGNLQGSSGGGGSGVVIIRYPDVFSISNPGGGLGFTTDSSSVAGYKITTFTAGTGSISFTFTANFTVTVTDQAALIQTSSKIFSLTVNANVSLYSFTSFTFTNGTQTGRLGPSLANLLSAYNTTSNPWLTNTGFFNTTNGIQLWTVPIDGTYRIDLKGASGGGNTSTTGGTLADPGEGARIIADVFITKNTVLNIVVGQTPFETGTFLGSAGGGGSWVYTGGIGGSGLIAVAGGGGGWGHGTTISNGGNGLGGNDQNDSRRVSINSTINGKLGNGTGSTNGIGQGGGISTTGGFGGAAGGTGWLSIGTNRTLLDTATGGERWNGGTSARSTALNGGFGGGGGANGNGIAGGGGGGYTGGPAGNDWGGSFWGNAGGGGSFWTGSLVSATQGSDGGVFLRSQAANGFVTITRL